MQLAVPNLAAEYTFASLTADDSGQIPALTNSGVTQVAGLVGQAASFTASSFASGAYGAGNSLVGGTATLAGTLPSSISFWFYAPTDPNQPNAAMMIAKYDAGTNQREFKYYLTYSSSTTVALHANISTDGTGSVQLFSGTAYATNTWHHVAIVLDVNSAKIYVDGLLDITSGGIPSFFHGTAPFAYGCQFTNGVANSFFNGLLDEVTWYGFALSQNQVTALFKVPGLVLASYTGGPLAVPTVSVADNQDGTGGVVTVSGSSLGSTSTVSTLFIPTNGPWTSQGSRSGDGSIALSLGTGWYWIVVTSTLPGQTPVVSAPLMFGLSASPLAVMTQLRNSLVAQYQNVVNAAKLPGIVNPASVLGLDMVPNPKDFPQEGYPAVWVLPGDRENPCGPVVNAADDYGHPVRVILIDRQDIDFRGPLPNMEMGRERLIKAVISQRLPGVQPTYTAKILPEKIVSFQSPGAYVYRLSSFVVNFYTRQPRGI